MYPKIGSNPFGISGGPPVSAGIAARYGATVLTPTTKIEEKSVEEVTGQTHAGPKATITPPINSIEALVSGFFNGLSDVIAERVAQRLSPHLMNVESIAYIEYTLDKTRRAEIEASNREMNEMIAHARARPSMLAIRSNLHAMSEEDLEQLREDVERFLAYAKATPENP